MEFKDFKPEELIGKKVKIFSGSPYRHIIETSIITRVTPTGKSFEIKDRSGSLFDSSHGKQKGGDAKCHLIKNEEYNQINTQNQITNECSKIRSKIIQKDWSDFKRNSSNLNKLKQAWEILESLEK